MARSKPYSPGAPAAIPEEEIIFSLKDDFVWASWPDTHAAVRLGRHDVVAAMMEDFLAQDALGRQLTSRPQHWIDPH